MTTTRLYISPLTPQLLESILPANARPDASDTSFHGIETFPEKNYGYVTIPTEQAQTLKRKLNGSFLKGMKVRVEEARPEKRKRKTEEAASNGDAMAEQEEPQTKPKRTKREKHTDGVLPAVELPVERQIKRGWVEKSATDKEKKHKSSDGKKEKKEKKVDRSQMLFRANLPPNVASNSNDTSKKDSKKEKKEKSGQSKKVVEVKEFEKTTKYPTFLRSIAPVEGNKTSTYIDGKGWVDEDGNIVEAAKPSRKRKATATASKKSSSRKPVLLKVSESEPNSESESDGSSDSDESVASTVSSVVSDTTSSEEDSGEEDLASPERSAPSSVTSASNITTPLAKSISEAPSVPQIATTPPKDVHPLEALFKRPAPASAPATSPTTSDAAAASTLARSTPRPAPIVTSFSFFDSDAADASLVDEDQGVDEDPTLLGLPQPPVTPFTRRDLEARGMRSAAPTPDTAAIGKTLRAPWMRPGTTELTDEEDDSDDEEAHEPIPNAADNGANAKVETAGIVPSTGEAGAEDARGKDQTDFEKHFWANRGEYNRAWKARKREARKEARQAENRRSGHAR